jgi:hypothetical protein
MLEEEKKSRRKRRKGRGEKGREEEEEEKRKRRKGEKEEKKRRKGREEEGTGREVSTSNPLYCPILHLHNSRIRSPIPEPLVVRGPEVARDVERVVGL